MVSCPTGALTNKGVAGIAIATGPDAQGFEAEDLLQIPVFKGVSGTFLSSIAARSSSAASAKTTIICREGEFGSHGFLHSRRKSQSLHLHSHRHVKTQGGARGFFKRLTSTLVAREEDIARRG